MLSRALASERVIAENVIRRRKVFRVLKETYRHRRKRFGLRVHLLAGLYNHDLQVKHDFCRRSSVCQTIFARGMVVTKRGEVLA